MFQEAGTASSEVACGENKLTVQRNKKEASMAGRRQAKWLRLWGKTTGASLRVLTSV